MHSHALLEARIASLEQANEGVENVCKLLYFEL